MGLELDIPSACCSVSSFPFSPRERVEMKV